MKHLTIRGIQTTLARALEAETKRRGQSLNRTVKELLERALGITDGGAYDNGLGELAGGWSERDLKDFEAATKGFEQVDGELWK